MVLLRKGKSSTELRMRLEDHSESQGSSLPSEYKYYTDGLNYR